MGNHFALTRPGLDYEDQYTTDPSTGMPIKKPAILKFFPNLGARALQFAKDASQAVQPSTANVTGELQPPSLSVGRDWQSPDPATGPPQAPAPMDISEVPQPDKTSVSYSTPHDGPTPAFFQPSFRQATQDENGLQIPINHGLTKGGALLSILAAAARGGLNGWGQMNAAAGAEAARQIPFQQAQQRQQLQHSGLENQFLQSEMQNLPNVRALNLARIRKEQAEAQRSVFQTPRNGGVFDTSTGKYVAPPNQFKDSAVEQRQSFAEDHADMFQGENEKRNFILYGAQPKSAVSNPNEWQLRISAAGGDPDAQAVLDRRFQEQRQLAGIRTSRQDTKNNDGADAEQVASKILNSAGGDPDRALRLFDERSSMVTDPNQRRLGPAIRKAIRARRQINKPKSAIDRILSGDVDGGMNQLQQQP